MIDPEETSSTPCPHCGHSPGSARSQPADVQPVPCNHTTIPQTTPCCCGKYTFPTFELETMDWSSGPITDDYGVHVVDGCLSGLRVGGVQSFSHTVTVSPHEIELLIDGLVTMMQDMYGYAGDVAPIVADNRRRHRDNLEALRQRLRDELTKEDNQGFTVIPLSSDDIKDMTADEVMAVLRRTYTGHGRT